jgi:hypothetical protein
MTKFKREDFKEVETYVKCRGCNYEISFCDSCENPIFDDTVWCMKGNKHICNECFEGEND